MGISNPCVAAQTAFFRLCFPNKQFPLLCVIIRTLYLSDMVSNHMKHAKIIHIQRVNLVLLESKNKCIYRENYHKKALKSIFHSTLGTLWPVNHIHNIRMFLSGKVILIGHHPECSF